MLRRMTDRILGVLGGMGPLASAHFMLRLTVLTPAARDPLPWLQRGIRGLRDAGCQAIAIPCNTAHGWHDELLAEGLPILHIVDAAALALRQVVTGGTIGVMGTTATLTMRLYQDRLEAQGWSCIAPSHAEMTDRVSPAIAAVKANRLADAYAPLAEAVRSLAARGAHAVVLGCTEIPLGIQAGPHADLAVPLIDTIDSLALAAIAWARS